MLEARLCRPESCIEMGAGGDRADIGLVARAVS